jgi:Phage integrase, N-terminal SAM-like domain
MGAIRDRMIEEMELRGMAAATKRSYLTCCRLFVAHFMRSPEQLGAEQVKIFLLHLQRVRKASPCTVRVHIAAICFLYRHALRMPGVVSCSRIWRDRHLMTAFALPAPALRGEAAGTRLPSADGGSHSRLAGIVRTALGHLAGRHPSRPGRRLGSHLRPSGRPLCA